MRKAIDTVYQGDKFRSRVEAKWAVFYHTLGIAYEYEKEGYILPNGTRYLCDFWLPELDCWVEIKGEKPTKEEEAKAEGLVEATGKDVYIFFGPIPFVEEDTCFLKCGVSGSSYAFSFHSEPNDDKPFICHGCDVDYWWCECPECGNLGIEYSGRVERIRHKTGCTIANDHKTYAYATPRLVAAYTAARQARFEYGEKGRRHV